MGTEFSSILGKLADKDNRAPGDYTENGLLLCGKCHAPKQRRQLLPDKTGAKSERLVPVSCRCELEAMERDKAKLETQEFRAWMQTMSGRFRVPDDTYQHFTFQMDDRRNAKVSTICRRYVEKWPEMEQNNMGILFYGSVGTGKSFYAAAIVNALLEQRIPATVTNFPRLLNILQGTRERQACIDHLGSYRLLVLDDLGVERDSTYAAEQIFSVIDSRSRSGLPLIVTTNMTLEELEQPPTMQFARIYDRLLELCPIRIRLTGESRRVDNAQRRTELARELLKGD